MLSLLAASIHAHPVFTGAVEVVDKMVRWPNFVQNFEMSPKVVVSGGGVIFPLDYLWGSLPHSPLEQKPLLCSPPDDVPISNKIPTVCDVRTRDAQIAETKISRYSVPIKLFIRSLGLQRYNRLSQKLNNNFLRKNNYDDDVSDRWATTSRRNKNKLNNYDQWDKWNDIALRLLYWMQN